MLDYLSRPVVDFEDLEVGDHFKIPFYFDHEMETFIKLPFNKARSLYDGKIEHFGDKYSVWLYE